MIKKAMCVAVSVAMAATATGCTRGGNNHAKADPALAKQGVYKYEEVDLGIEKGSYYDIIAVGRAGDNAQIMIQDYSGDDACYNVYTIDNDGKVKGSHTLAPLDTTAYEEELEQMEGEDYSGYYGVDDAVGDAGTEYPDEVVLTMAVDVLPDTVEDVEDDVFQEYEGEVDDDYYYDDDYNYDYDYDYDYEPEDGMSYSYTYFDRVDMGDDGRIVAVGNFNASGYFDGKYKYIQKYVVGSWDSNGELLWQVDLTDATQMEYIWVNAASILNNGNLFLLVGGDKNQAFTFDNNGNIISQKDASQVQELNDVYSLSTLRDGRMLLMYGEQKAGGDEWDYETKCAFFDPETISIKGQADVPEFIKVNSYGRMYPGIDRDLIASSSSGLYKFNVGDEEAKMFMSYINSDLETDSMNNIVMLDEKHFIASYYSNNSDYYGQQVSVFTYVDPEDIPDKEIITIATYYIDYSIRSEIIDFNKESDKYRIVVNNYDQYATDDDYTAGYKQMNNDIISGNCPDLVIAGKNDIDFVSYANKGLLVNFDDLFAKDEELKDNEYLTNVFDAFSIKGKHYLGVYEFDFESLMGSSKYFGDKTSWTISDFKNMQSSFPAGSSLIPYTTQTNFLNTLMQYDGSEFVDVETGKCDFDSEDFITLLEYAASLPEEYEWNEEDYYGNYTEQFRSGKTLLCYMGIYDPNDYQRNRYEYFNGESALVGFPSRTGDSSIISAYNYPFAIFKGGNVDGAWEFVRHFFTKEYQDELQWTIPVLESAFDAWAAKGMERPHWEYDGQIEYYDNYYYIDDVSYVIPVMTQEEVDAMKATIKSCEKVGYNNQEILKIIEEEASACFAGQKSAAEVAKVIQSRVQLYINENN